MDGLIDPPSDLISDGWMHRSILHQISFQMDRSIDAPSDLISNGSIDPLATDFISSRVGKKSKERRSALIHEEENNTLLLLLLLNVGL
jgi:hypothetical protein